MELLGQSNEILSAANGGTVDNEIKLTWGIDQICFSGVGLLEQMFLAPVPFRNIETDLNPYQIPKGNIPHVYQTLRRFL